MDSYSKTHTLRWLHHYVYSIPAYVFAQTIALHVNLISVITECIQRNDDNWRNPAEL